MAKKLRKMGTGSSDVVVVPTDTGRHIFNDEGDGTIGVYMVAGVEGADTIYALKRREPKAQGVVYAACRHGDGA